MRRKRTLLFALLALLLCGGAAGLLLWREYPHHTLRTPESVPEASDPVLTGIRRGLAFLRSRQEEDGHFVAGRLAPKAAFTALAIEVFVTSPEPLTAEDPVLKKALSALQAERQTDGGIYSPLPGMTFGNYSTALAVVALRQAGLSETDPLISDAVRYLRSGQKQGGKADPLAGGFGYQPGASPDLNNSLSVLEALKESGIPPEDPAFQAALDFLQNTQNRSESNPQPWAGNDGGFIYRPGDSPAGQTTGADGRIRFASYGTMTYAGLVSFLHARVDRDDPRVQSAYDWVRKHYDLRENVGLKDVGLYYYYRIMAKALTAYDEPEIKTPDGKVHFWAKDLADTLLKLQRPDGSWINANTAYLEGDAVLVSAYAIRALSLCYEQLRSHPPHGAGVP